MRKKKTVESNDGFEKFQQLRIAEIKLHYILKIVWTVMAAAVVIGMLGCSAKHVKATEDEAKAILGDLARSKVEEVAASTKETINRAVDTIKDEVTQPIESWRYAYWDVQKGDCLWKIAANESVYGDPFLWPLIYKKNRDQISDPDLIEVGQRLNYLENYSPSDASKARQAAYEYGE